MIIILKAKAGNFIRDNNKEGVAGNIEIMKWMAGAGVNCIIRI